MSPYRFRVGFVGSETAVREFDQALATPTKGTGSAFPKGRAQPQRSRAFGHSRERCSGC